MTEALLLIFISLVIVDLVLGVMILKQTNRLEDRLDYIEEATAETRADQEEAAE